MNVQKGHFPDSINYENLDEITEYECEKTYRRGGRKTNKSVSNSLRQNTPSMQILKQSCRKQPLWNNIYFI